MVPGGDDLRHAAAEAGFGSVSASATVTPGLTFRVAESHWHVSAADVAGFAGPVLLNAGPADSGAEVADLAAFAAARTEHHWCPSVVALLADGAVFRDPVDCPHLAAVDALVPWPIAAVQPLVAGAADGGSVLVSSSDLPGDAAEGTRRRASPVAAGFAPGALVGVRGGHDVPAADAARLLRHRLAVAAVTHDPRGGVPRRLHRAAADMAGAGKAILALVAASADWTILAPGCDTSDSAADGAPLGAGLAAAGLAPGSLRIPEDRMYRLAALATGLQWTGFHVAGVA